MGWLAPLMFLWLLPVASLIIAMYLLKLRRRDVVVPSTLLWERVIRDVQANAPFQRLRRNLLLILQILAALLLVMALARPYVRRTTATGRSIVLIVDTSASMEATDVRPNRLAQAQELARSVIAAMSPQDAGMVIAAANRPIAVTGFTDRRSELAQAVSQLRPHAASCDMQGALSLAAAVVAPRSEGEIHVFSDGGFPQVGGVNLGKAHIVFHAIGRSSNNVGIIAADYRRSLARDGMVDVLATLHNFDSKRRTFTMDVLSGSTLLDAHEVTLEPHGERPEFFQIPEPATPLLLTINLEVHDDFTEDNRAYLIIHPAKPIRALLVGAGDVFLEEGIQADASVELTETSLAAFKGPANYDVVIFDGACPQTLPPGNYVFVNCTANRAPAQKIGVAHNQGVIVPDAAHPVLRYVDLTSVQWTAMSVAQPKTWARGIASCAGGSAMVVGEEGGYRTIWLGFNLDLAHGPFPLTVGYPIFLSNLLHWTAHADEHSDQIQTGTPATIRAPIGVTQVIVTKPDGTRHSVPVAPSGIAGFDDTDEVGTYTAQGPGGYVYQFAANLADYNESQIAPRKPDLPAPAPMSARHPQDQRSGRVIVSQELAPALAGVLIAILMLEWWLYHRRIHLS